MSGSEHMDGILHFLLLYLKISLERIGFIFFELMRYVSTPLPVKSLRHFSFKHLLVKLCVFFFFFHSMLLVYFRP